jgi:uncharacterized protein YndB with AHSA1/START domain
MLVPVIVPGQPEARISVDLVGAKASRSTGHSDHRRAALTWGTVDDMSVPPLLGRADPASGAVQLQHVLPASIGAAWEALTTPAHTITWLGRLTGAPLREGASVALWHDEHVRSDHYVLQCDPPRALRLTWDFPDESPSTVLFSVAEAAPGSTRFTVLHEGLEDPVSYAAGWHRHVEYLDAHLRGTDLSAVDFWDGYQGLVERYQEGVNRPQD